MSVHDDKNDSTRTLRHASEFDLAAIVAIYNSSIPSRLATADTEPLTVNSRKEWFLRHDTRRRPLMVLEVDGVMAGWFSFEDFYGRPAYQYTAELSIYVAPAYQGRGFGKYLLDIALSLAPDLPVRTVLAYVFAHNKPSLELFRKAGFESWAKLPDIAEMDGNEYSLCIMGRRL